MPRLFCTVIFLALLVGLDTSCRKRQVRVPVPATPQSTPAAEPAPPIAPPATPEPAPPASQPPSSPPVQETKPSPLGPPANPPAVPAQPPAAQPPPTAPSTPPARRPTRPANNAPAPRLGDVLTADQQRQYNAAIDQSLSRAQNSLNQIASRRLTKEQETMVGQIQSFIQQAQAARKSNLAAARSLAERADVLARDLAGSLR